jgi:hypothetical protein
MERKRKSSGCDRPWDGEPWDGEPAAGEPADEKGSLPPDTAKFDAD